jgi:hypothetical protein
MKTKFLAGYGTLVLGFLLASAPAHAFPGNNAGGTLTASGNANVFSPPGSPLGNIAGGTFNINANINFNAQTASGTLSIGGTIAGLGFNSGTLLTGTLNSTPASQTFGAGAGDPLEFLFTVTGGDAAGLYGGVGSTAGIILSQSGYAGSFAGDFSSAPFGALADTFQFQPGPAPSIGGEVTGLVVRTIDCKNKTTKQKVRIMVNGSTTTWDCEAAGLIVSPGDKIDIKIKGNAN